MDGFWQDRINDELRTLRRAEAREQMSMEDRLLRAGRLEQKPVSVESPPVTLVQRYWLTLSRILVGWWHTRRAALGAVLPAVADGAGQPGSAD